MADNGAAPNQTGGQLSPDQVRAVAYQAGFRGSALNTAVQITTPESNRVPTEVYNPGPQEHSIGLWQINVVPGANPQYASWNLTDPLTNAKAAFAISKGGTDFTPWTTYTSGKYQGAPAGSGIGSSAPSMPGPGNAVPGAQPSSQPATPTGPLGTSKAGVLLGYLKSTPNNLWDTSKGQGQQGFGGGDSLIKALTVAQSTLQAAAGSTTLTAHPAIQAATQAAVSSPTSLHASGQAGGFLPAGATWVPGRADQGRDGTTNPGGPIIAPGDGYVVRIGSDPNGFGPAYPIIHLTTGPYAGRTMYIGHTLAAVQGGSFKAGQVLSHTGTHGVGNATVPGWVEIGFADSGSPGPMGQQTPF